MRIHAITTAVEGNHSVLSGQIDDEALWFRFPSALRLQDRADAFVAAALPLAMKRATPLVVEAAPVSPTLLESLPRLQEVFHSWNPTLQLVSTTAETQSHTSGNEGTAAFFSGGIDSLHTLSRHSNEITHLLFFLSGFDLEPGEASARRLEQYSQTALRFGKTLVPITTNFREFADRHHFRWGLAHGFVLAAVALALGFQRVYVPSSYTYRDLEPWGSHPLTDELWRTERTHIVHDGAGSTRFEKTAHLVTAAAGLEDLHVCWNVGTHNCGRCSKCVRTRAALRILGANVPTLEPLVDLSLVRRLRPHNRLSASFLEDLERHATLADDVPLAKALRRQLRRYELKEIGLAIDRTLLGSMARRLYLARAKPDWVGKTAAWGERA